MALLARREHARRELADKLARKGCDAALASEVVAALERERLLSEERFAEALVRARQERGYGPVRVRRELEQKGVAPELVERALEAAATPWAEVLRRERRKKFGARLPRSFAERARQARFLQYRGFSFDQIHSELSPGED